MRFPCVIMVIALFMLSGCATFKVEDISGIKSMLNNKIEAEYWASKVKIEYTGGDREKIKELYNEAYLENNKWIAGIKLDVQSKDKLKVSQDDYSNHLAGSTSAQFISSAKKTLVSKDLKSEALTSKGIELSIGMSPGNEAATFVNKILNNIIEQHNKKAEEARKRIYEELEKAKWEELK